MTYRSSYDSDEITGYEARVKRHRPPAAVPEFRYKCAGGVKARALYGELHDAWRAGVIADFYYGTRSETDSTLIWKVNGSEVTMGEARDYLARYMHTLGIVSIEIGQPWCGYPSMTVKYRDGSVLTDRYDGRSRVESLDGRPVARESVPAVSATRAPCTGRDLFPELSVEAF